MHFVAYTKRTRAETLRLERQPRDGLPALMMADQKGNYMTVAERKINTEDLISFEEIAKKHIAGEYLAII